MQPAGLKYRYFRQCAMRLTVVSILALILSIANAQVKDSLPLKMSLDECISYAVNHQPYVQQALTDEAITETVIKGKLSAWYPQLNLSYNIQHYLQQPRVTNPTVLRNSSIGSLTLTQNIFNSDVLLATKTAGDVRMNARQNTQLSKIDMVVDVSKAFYDVLISQKQIDILAQDILRLQKSLKDASLRYQAGTSDKTDYKRATIALNNAVASKKQYEQMLKAKIAALKQQMGYTGNLEFQLVYNDKDLENEVGVDTIGLPSYRARVEFQQLETQKNLLEYNRKYARWSYLPSVSFFGIYNMVGQNNEFSKIYSATFPNSLYGLTLSVPIFQGSKRIQQLKEADLQLQRLGWDFQELKAEINTEYISALSAYRTSVTNYAAAKDNLALAQDVYKTIQLQYISGINTYLDVIIAETDLRTAEVGSLDALYEVLSSKLDLQKSAGAINY